MCHKIMLCNTTPLACQICLTQVSIKKFVKRISRLKLPETVQSSVTGFCTCPFLCALCETLNPKPHLHYLIPW